MVDSEDRPIPYQLTEKASYSEMNDRELLTHVARNSDQLCGFSTGMVHVLGEIRDGRVTLPEGSVMGIGTSIGQFNIGSGIAPMTYRYWKRDNELFTQLLTAWGEVLEQRIYAIIPDNEWAKSKGYR